ncbi:MAG: heme-dependent oxidative N-demethylase subunit alpha family protein [Mycobacteriales bacterium]
MRGLPRVAPPFPVEAPHRVVPAPRPLDGPHVVLDDAWPKAVARRLERLTDEVVVRDPDDPDDAGLAAALRVAWSLLPPDGVGLLGLAVDLDGMTARQVGDSACQDATDEVVSRTGLDLLVLGWQLACSDDLVVLRRRGPGRLAAELLAVSFPSGWPVRRGAGASLLELHAPVAGGERLQRAAPALSEALLTKGPYVQHVWGLNRCGRLDDDPDETYPDEPLRWHLRVERQTTLPLPHLDRALFTIRPYLTPVDELTREQRRVLDAAIASLSPQALRYKGLQLWEGSSG